MRSASIASRYSSEMSPRTRKMAIMEIGYCVGQQKREMDYEPDSGND